MKTIKVHQIPKLFLTIVLLISYSCSNEISNPSESDSSDPLLKAFSVAIPHEYDNVDLSSRTTKSYVDPDTGDSKSIVSYEVRKNNLIKGYVISLDDQYSYVRVSPDKYIYESLETNDLYVFEKLPITKENPVGIDFESHYIVKENGETMYQRCDDARTLCNTSCTIAALVMALSDGPLPSMDVIAIASWAVCHGTCEANYSDCQGEQ